MPLEVYQDGEEEAPQGVQRRVSFAAGSRAPLTPHTKKKVRSKTPKTLTKNIGHTKNKLKSQTSTMENGKENQQSGMTSLRRQLRATMSPSAINKENNCTSRTSNASTSTKPTALTPSLRQNTRQTSKSTILKTPKSLLKKELEFNEADESLLISPAAADEFSLANESSMEIRHQQPMLRSPFEKVQRESRNHEMKEEMSAVVNAGTTLGNDVEPIAYEATTKGELQRIFEECEKVESREMTGRAEKRALLRQQRLQQSAITTISKKETGTTPYRIRGNGVQMDLSSMFTDIASPLDPDKTRVESTTRKETNSMDSTLENVPAASLDNLGESLWLDFGDERKNEVGSARTLSFAIEAPAGEGCIAEVERVPFKKGFDLIIDKGSIVDPEALNKLKPTSIRLNCGERVLMRVSWTPTKPGGVREVIYLKLPRGRLCVIVHGKARSAKQVKKVNICKVSACSD